MDVDSFRAPLLKLVKRDLEHPLPHWGDQSGGFCYTDKGRGVHKRTVIGLDSSERLDPHDSTIRQVDNRLVVNSDEVFGNCPPESLRRFDVRHGSRFEFLCVVLNSVSTVVLCPVHGEVCAPQQVLSSGLGIGRGGNPDADRDAILAVIDPERLPHRLTDSLTNHTCLPR